MDEEEKIIIDPKKSLTINELLEAKRKELIRKKRRKRTKYYHILLDGVVCFSFCDNARRERFLGTSRFKREAAGKIVELCHEKFLKNKPLGFEEIINSYSNILDDE